MIKTFKRALTVTGLSQYNFESIKNKIFDGVVLDLRRDAKNRYDEYATGVYFRGEQIGWIKKSENEFLSDVLRGNPNASRARVHIFAEANPIWKSNLVVMVQLAVPDPLFSRATEDRWVESGSTHEGYIDTFERNDTVWGRPSAPNFNTSNAIAEEVRKQINKPTTKETIMAKIVDTNKQIATQAAFMEASRVLLNQATKVVAKQAPMFVKGYVDTPFGKLALANAMVMAVNQFRPNDARLVRLANAALGQAYQEVYKSFDIEKFIEGFLDNETIKAALTAADEATKDE